MTGKKIDDTRARRMWADGASDRQIAEAMGVGRTTVAKWRGARGLRVNILPRPREFDTAKARDMWAAGASDGNIAEALSVSRTAIQKWRKSEGLHANTHPHQEKIDSKQAREMWAYGASDGQIARAQNLSRQTVTMWRKRNGLEAKHPPHGFSAVVHDLTEDQFRHAMRRKSLHQASLELGAHWTTLKRKAEREGWI